MPPPCPEIYLLPRVTLILDLLTTKVDHFTPCLMDHLCQVASKSVDSFSKYCVYMFDSGQTTIDKWTGWEYDVSTCRSGWAIKRGMYVVHSGYSGVWLHWHDTGGLRQLQCPTSCHSFSNYLLPPMHGRTRRPAQSGLLPTLCLQ